MKSLLLALGADELAVRSGGHKEPGFLQSCLLCVL